MKFEETISKASILCEALPYIQKFRKALMVIKFGGSSMEDPELVKSTMRDIVLMECIGFSPVVDTVTEPKAEEIPDSLDDSSAEYIAFFG